MKKVRWMFYFEEGSVNSDLSSQEEDARIREALTCGTNQILTLPHTEMEIWVNLNHVKCTTRSMIDVEEQKVEEAAEAQPC